MNTVEKVQVRPVITGRPATNKTVEFTRAVKRTAEVASVCKDGVCSLSWKPLRPGSAA